MACADGLSGLTGIFFLTPHGGGLILSTSGDSSLIYLLTHLGELWRERALLERAKQLVVLVLAQK
jgi:hypothetical protein